MTVRVTDYYMSTSSNGLEVQVTVRRGTAYHDERTPSVADVPADIRAALTEWLGAQERATGE